MTSQYLADSVSATSTSIWASKWWNSPIGSIVATSGLRPTVSLWDPQQPSQPLATLALPSALGINKLDAKDDTLITCSLDSTVCKWKLNSDASCSLAAKTNSQRSDTFTIALHPTSNIYSSTGRNGHIKLHSSETDGFGEEISSFKGRGDFGMALTWNRIGSLLAASTDKGHISIHDAETSNVIDSFPAHTASIRSLSFSPNSISNFLISGGDDGRINVFDIRTSHSASRKGGGGHIAQFRFGSSTSKVNLWVTTVAIKSDGRVLTAGGSDGSVAIFDLSSMSSSPLAVYPRQHTGDVWSISWKPEDVDPNAIEGLSPSGGGRWISCGDDGMIKWCRASGR